MGKHCQKGYFVQVQRYFAFLFNSTSLERDKENCGSSDFTKYKTKKHKKDSIDLSTYFRWI